MQVDKELGQQVHEHLVKLGLETPMIKNDLTASEKIDQIQAKMQEVMTIMGLDMTDDSLVDTPNRVAKMWINEFMAGLDYDNFPKMTCVENKMAADGEFVCIRNINVVSVCEHHLLPFANFGNLPGVSIAYIPKVGGKVLGLSKAGRLLDFFAARPQVQERLTNQVFEALKFIMDTEDVAVYIDSQHTCMSLRGAKNPSSTVTLAAGGRFVNDPSIRKEFLAIAKQPRT